MGAINAMEDVCGVTVDPLIRDLRRLIYCGEWIESHILHVFMLHAPDFLGYEDAVRMAKDHPDLVKRGLEMKKIDNEILEVIGGRAIHPVNLKVGGFYSLPKTPDIVALRKRVEWVRDAAVETIELLGTLDYPEFERDYEYIALQHPDEYAICEGRLVSNRGLDIEVQEFEQHIEEEHVEHSTSLHAALKARGPYFVGPMARYNLNYEQLSETARAAAQAAGLAYPCNNPFKSIIIRMVEVLYACEEALRLTENYDDSASPAAEVTPKAGRGCGCTEAPRGICYHRYDIDGTGEIQEARIVPPTSQNQRTIEEDLYHYVEQYVDLPDDELQWQCEQAVRNYDPCISCSCHFLKLTVDRE
jgi:coenzyme F420-reducing hydrogenase alpha subunit